MKLVRCLVALQFLVMTSKLTSQKGSIRGSTQGLNKKNNISYVNKVEAEVPFLLTDRTKSFSKVPDIYMQNTHLLVFII